MAKKELSAAQKDQLKAMGIDWKNLDWNRAFSLLMLIVQLFASPQPPQAKAVMKDCPDEHCDKLQCHLDVVHSAAHTLDDAMKCYQHCVEECTPS